jgi:uncharacterized protein (TIGR02271 family)
MRKEDERKQNPEHSQSKKIDIIEERLVVDKEKVGKGKVKLQKRVIEEDVPLDLELTEEHIDVEVKRIGEVVDKPGPAVREEGDTKIYSVYREVYVKQTILEEEVRITRNRSTKPFHTSENLRREVIDVERFSGEQDSSQNTRERERYEDAYGKREDKIRTDRDNRREPDKRDEKIAGHTLQGDDPKYNQQGDLSGYGRMKE